MMKTRADARDREPAIEEWFECRRREDQLTSTVLALQVAIADTGEGETKCRELYILRSFHLILWKKKLNEVNGFYQNWKKLRKGELIEARDSTASVQVLKGIKLIVRGKGEMAI
ncbi:hypothetical protein SLA2020_130400 [Shorea laevis]